MDPHIKILAPTYTGKSLNKSPTFFPPTLEKALEYMRYTPTLGSSSPTAKLVFQMVTATISSLSPSLSRLLLGIQSLNSSS